MTRFSSFCDRVAEALEAVVAGTLPGDERRAVDEHLQGCADCRLLVELAGETPAVSATAADAPDLTAGVLRATAGDPCARAGELLCDRVDGGLADMDAELVDLHVSRCETCDGLLIMLAHLSEVLPRMATEMPDERFVDDVLARTLPLSSRLRRFAARTATGWQALLQRPRFSWEAAYVGAAMLSLVFGAPASPLRDVPKQALAMVQAQNLEGTDTRPPVVHQQLAAGGNAIWSWTGEPALSFLGRVKTDVSALVERTADEREQLVTHAGELGRAALRIETRGSLTALGNMGDDMKALWSELARGDDKDNGNESDEPVAQPE